VRRILTLVGVAALASALTTAVIALPARAGGGENDGREAFDRRLADFGACMREHGFDFGPETKVEVDPDGVRVNGAEVDPEAFREARRECGGLPVPAVGLLLPPGGDDPAAVERRLERLRACAEEAEGADA
jgi:hypothetical protein